LRSVLLSSGYSIKACPERVGIRLNLFTSNYSLPVRFLISHLTAHSLNISTDYSAILDFVLALLPWQILMGLTMKTREKVGVAIAMSLGAV
jgi:hypothetical protein